MLNQLQRAFEGEAWHGPSVLEALEGVTWSTAFERRVPGAHSIWELVLHMAAWKDIVRQRLLGEYPDVTDELNFPTVRDPDDASWSRAIEVLKTAHARLREVVSAVTDGDLDERPSSRTSARYIQIHGIIQHDLYHAGQISILKK